eukprot:gnl/TRDRNA2_/TRDRNA2_189550_c0_seq1.p1 gnl/TRDRNA2_/TRDRNA2_189550_c0~~gnl/TRDRNA2_/TRDRNA2_189550_c0_seq1.p1  ORF type:complete len:672 (+),score=152.42 gnl/TRDRNA2_/TRDRNA2_189550_c0_seq1:77-2092(+)
MNVIVVATYEDFDETLDKRQRGPGNGRKHATQAMLQYLSEQAKDEIARLDFMILDWKNPPKGGAKEIKVSLNRGACEKTGIWGSREQLSMKFPQSRWDLAICSQVRRFALDFTGTLNVKRRLAMVHDYNLPFGPWGQELTAEQSKEHRTIAETFELMCASKHLVEFVEKWGEGAFRSRLAYAADYGYFDPVPQPFSPWESKHSCVTFVSPCPEKGLCIFAKLAEMMPQTEFLAIKTTHWTKSYHEQMLKKLPNVRVQAASERINEFLALTRVLIVPSVSQEACSLIITEAQLRGIPVVSTDVCGIGEANCVPSLRVSNISIVYDQRTHETITGMTMDEAESTLDPERPGALTMEQWRQAAANQESQSKVAMEEDVEPFAAALRQVLDGGEHGVKQASQDARLAASSFVEGRRGKFMASLKKIIEEHIAAGDEAPKPALKSAALTFTPKARVKSAADDSDDTFDCTQDFTKVENFDGQELATRLLVRLAEQGNLTVLAELLNAKADVNRAETQIGITPLIGAANAGHVDICKYLFRKEADVNVRATDGTERTALHSACQMGFASVVQLLLEKRAEPRAKDLTQTNCLHLAVRNGHCGATDLLLQHKANPNETDDQGQVPINDAVAKDRFDLVTKLLEHGALVNVRNMAGLEAISFSRTPTMQGLIMKNDINF